eukprot:189295_1
MHRRNTSADFEEWYKANGIVIDGLNVGDFVYDKTDKKFGIIQESLDEEQRYFWNYQHAQEDGDGRHEQYCVGSGQYCDPLTGIGTGVTMRFMNHEIERIGGRLEMMEFYIKKMAKDHCIYQMEEGVLKQFNKRCKAKRLRFYRELQWSARHFYEEKLRL